MRKLALRDEILLQIDKAARYIGGEVNAVMKNKEDVDIRFAMAFPDVYEIGMSNLGMMILYDMFNKRDDVWCERLFSPWTDLDKIMREEHIPLFTLESQDPVKEFDFLGITLGYEMCYTNVLQLLDLSGIPLLAEERNPHEFSSKLLWALEHPAEAIEIGKAGAQVAMREFNYLNETKKIIKAIQ